MLDAQELKEILGQQAKNIIASGLNIREVRGKAVCPLHNDKVPSMSWFKDGLMWKCHACGEQIDIYRYYTEFEHMSFLDAVDKVAELVGKGGKHFETRVEKKGFTTPNIKTTELTEPLIQYMAKRKISKQTLDDWKVKQGKFSGKDVYVFQYFQNNKLIFVSYREPIKGGLKGGCESNTKAILWGMDHIDKTKPLVIVEGQPDAMAVWESGYKNVVSVPAGSNNLSWIDYCWEWLQDVKEIIVYADNDKPGREMGENIKQRLKNVKVMFSEKHKDANEDLFYEGKEYVLNSINKAIRRTPEGLLEVSSMEYRSAIETQQEGIETGFIEYDEYVEDWKTQELTIVFGRNGEGKTTFISQVIAHCLMKNVKVFLYSGEMSERKIQDWLYKQIAGNKEEYFRYIQCKYKVKAEIKPEIVTQIKKWHQDKLYLFDRTAEKVSGDISQFFKIMEIAANRYGVKLFVIDNLMSRLEENADSLYSDQANFVQACKNFAVANNVHVVLLAHPNKEKREITDPNAEKGNLEKNDISGSNNIGNKADNIIAVERIFAEEGNVPSCDAIITSLKNREDGARKTIRFNFSKKTLRFYNNRTNETVDFGWDAAEKMKINPKYIHEDFEPVNEKAPWDM